MKDTIAVVSVPTFDVQVDIGDNFFNPAVVQINIGQTIRWMNNGTVDHTSTSADGLWDSGTLGPSQFFDFTFMSEGVHDYACSFHPEMLGTVIVGRPDSVAADIQIVDFAFVPADIEVTVGQYVRWINMGAVAHTSTSLDGVWDSGNMDPGDVFTLHADSIGTFDYHCSYHPQDMTGVLRVAPPIDMMVDIQDFFFQPAVIQIDPGQTVRWHNMGTRVHTTTSDDGFWDSHSLAPGEHFDFTFANEGVYDCHCEMHPLIMHGTVIVGRPDSVAADIEIGDNFFQPQQVSALIGQNVRWINFGSMAHTTTDTSQDYWDSGNLDPGNVFILHAGMVGQFHYICTIHAGMAGVLVVQDTAAGNCFYIPGDINENGQANGVDVGYGVNYFKGFGDAPPVSCPDCPSAGQQLYGAGDVNGNCQFNGVDISYFVNYLKGVGPALSYCISCPPAARQSR